MQAGQCLLSLAQQQLDPTQDGQVPDQDTRTHLAKECHRLLKILFGCLIFMLGYSQNTAYLEQERPGFGACQGSDSCICLGKPLFGFREVSLASCASYQPWVNVAQLVGLLATACKLHPVQKTLLHLVKLTTPEVGHGQ